MGGLLVTPSTFNFFSGIGTPGSQASAQDSGNCNDPNSVTFPCGQGVGYSCPDAGPFLCGGGSGSNPPGPSSPGGSSGGTGGWAQAISNLGVGILQDVLAYKTRSQQIAAGQYPASYGTLFGSSAAGGLNLGSLLPWLLIGLVLLLVFSMLVFSKR